MVSSVHVIGAGLIGTSIGIGLRGAGVTVTIEDADSGSASVARKVIADEQRHPDSPQLVIVAVPPLVTVDVARDALARFPSAVVTDVASVKAPVVAAVASDRFVGSHPMAGREISGALAAQGDLFRARPWVICPGTAGDAAVALVREVAERLGADAVVMDAGAHDAAVTRVSHVPQAVASATATALGRISGDAVSLAGQGLRDVTRIANSPDAMWAQIAELNEENVRLALSEVAHRLADVAASDDLGAAFGSLVAAGREQAARIPGKHGGPRRDWSQITVIVPDEPGQMLRLLQHTADAGVNVEDLILEHSPRQRVGLATLSVDPARKDGYLEVLDSHGWEVVAE